MRLADAEARRRLTAARVAYLATVRTDGRPHVVPIVFAVDGDLVYSVADPKPKDRPDLLRFQNIRAHPQVSLLVDEYNEAWERLWWVRVDGPASIVEEGAQRDLTIRLLQAKYEQYATWSEPFGSAMVAPPAYRA